MPLEAPPPEEEVASSSDATEVLAEEGIGQAVATGRSHGLLRLMERGHAAGDPGEDGRRRDRTWRRGTAGCDLRARPAVHSRECTKILLATAR